MAANPLTPMKFKIEIQSLGYENHALIVERPSRGAVTKTDVLQAKIEWCALNDVDEDTIELPFHRITRIETTGR